MKFEFTLSADHDIIPDGLFLVEQILVQSKLDKATLFSEYSHFGIGCNCKANPSGLLNAYDYNLYCVLAVAREIRPKQVIERTPRLSYFPEYFYN